MNKKKVMILSGGFDPIHSGHIEMFRKAAQQSDFVVVCVNSDEWVTKKRGLNFLPIVERLNILKNIRWVDDAISFEDDEFGSAINGIKKVVELYQNAFKDQTLIGPGEVHCETPMEVEFFFGNGGDRKPNTTPSREQKYCEENNIQLAWNLGEDKVNSSSWILNRYTARYFEMDDRVWGNYKVVYQDSLKKVKVLEILPGKSISLQSHAKRSEHWVVVEGTADVYIETLKSKTHVIVERNESVYVPVGAIHQLSNNTEELLQIVEVQVGEYLGEDDIVRYD